MAPGADLAVNRPEHEEAIRTVLMAEKKTGKTPGIECFSAEVVNRRIEQGFRFLPLSGDLGFMMRAAQEALERVKRD
jgi:2-keto-3-deoxy-L-rhamnonate aldolase RhmA